MCLKGEILPFGRWEQAFYLEQLVDLATVTAGLGQFTLNKMKDMVFAIFQY